ncbi:MAG: hypothetical protein AAF515_17920 [Pseudomonadota bacterium]
MTSRLTSIGNEVSRRRSRARRFAAFLAVPALTAALPAAALDYTIGAGYTLETTDNVGRTTDNEVSDLINIPQVQASVSHLTSQFELDANYRFERRIYVEDLFQDRTRLTGSAQVAWHAIPERLRLNVSNSRTEATIQSLAQDIENNRQLTTVTSVGPVLSLRPRPSDRFNLEYRFSDVTEEETDSDSERQLFRIGYVAGLSANRNIGIEASRDSVEFEADFAPSLDINNASVTYNSRSELLDVQLKAGYSNIERSLGADDLNAFVGNLSVNWTPTGGSSFNVLLRRTLSDQSENLLRGTGQFGQGSVIDNSELNDVFTEDTVRASYTLSSPRNSVTLAFSLQNQDYEDDFVLRDEDETGFSVNVQRRVTPRITAGASIEFVERDFLALGVKDDFVLGGANVRWQLSRKTLVRANVGWEERDSSRSDLGFSQFVGRIGFIYNLVDRQQR